MKRSILALVPIVVLGLLAGCGGSPDDADDGVASLGSTTTVASDATAAADDGAELDPEDAVLAYTECMRDHGIDMPDPQISSDGKGVIAITRESDDDGPSVDVDSEQFQAAEAECSPIMDDAVGSIEVDPEQQAEMREQLLAYAECMREHGIDFPDPEFGGNGRVTMGVGPGPDGEGPSDAEGDAMDEANVACATDGGPVAMPAVPAGGEG